MGLTDKSVADEITRREFIRKSVVGGASLLISGSTLQGESTQEGASDRRPVLENDLIRIELDPRSGDIIGLYNKRSGREYISAKGWARAFRLNVPVPGRITGLNADYSANSFDSWKQNKCTISHETSDQGQGIKIRYELLTSEAGTFPIEVAYTVHLANRSDEATLQIEVSNHSQLEVREVFFPWISGVGEVESGKTDTFVAPNMIYPATDLRNYFFKESNWEEFPYLIGVPTWPDGYSLSMPWMNYGGETEGLYLASRARTGMHHMLIVQDFAQDFGAVQQPILGFAWAFPSFIAPGRSWRSPELVLSLHHGDWHAAADRYRSSLDGWYRRPDTQTDFRKAFASFNSFFTARDFMQIAEIAEDIRKYDLHHLVMWNFGDYYPNVMDPDDLSVDPPRLGQFTAQWGGAERLRAANKRARDLGVATGIIFSQRLWNKDTLTPELRTLAEEWVIRGESGDPMSESWNHQHLGATQWTGEHLDYIMCSGVENYRGFAVRNVRGVLQRAGYSMMFYDQVVEGNLCFSARHHHADVSAPSMATLGFIEVLKREMKEDNPDAVLIGEGWEVLSTQYLDSGWVWRLPPNPEVLRYTLPWVINSAAVEAEAGQANKNFILGLHLAIVAGGLENGKKLSDFPEFAQHIARLASFREKTERFWVDGSFQDDLGLKVSGVYAKVYQTGQEVAIMMANLTDAARTATFELDMKRYGIVTTTFSIISSYGNPEQGNGVSQGKVSTGSKSFAPHEVAAVIFSRHVS